MNDIDNKLDLIGFKNFINLDKNKRDNLERKVFNSYYKDIFLSIRIKKIGEFWSIEAIEDNGVIKKTINKNEELDIKDIIYFFKNFYFENDFSNHL